MTRFNSYYNRVAKKLKVAIIEIASLRGLDEKKSRQLMKQAVAVSIFGAVPGLILSIVNGYLASPSFAHFIIEVFIYNCIFVIIGILILLLDAGAFGLIILYLYFLFGLFAVLAIDSKAIVANYCIFLGALCGMASLFFKMQIKIIHEYIEAGGDLQNSK
jgi:hypothetical protein